ncbi:MAG TPA: hypothetical protein VFF28_06545, partial [Candidatus Nanoarchaeia archaeon]|nr:hypothetical protein [Candidatus Nanoarchaeia archaeon]
MISECVMHVGVVLPLRSEQGPLRVCLIPQAGGYIVATYPLSNSNNPLAVQEYGDLESAIKAHREVFEALEKDGRL